MRKFKNLQKNCLFFLLCALLAPNISFAAETPAPPSSQVTILAPEGLENKEQADLERQYRFDYRNKEMLLSPYAASAASPDGGISEAELQAISEKEKLYRYFGIATELHKEGKNEEAAEILKYILIKNPNDEYVKNYLKKIADGVEAKRKSWGKTVKEDAKLLKAKQIRDLTREGLDAYKKRDFDSALLKFVDVLALDPNNNTAKEYVKELKNFYLKEVRVENIVTDWALPDKKKEEQDKPDLSSLTKEEPFTKEEKDFREKIPQETQKQKIPTEEDVFNSIEAPEYKEIFNYYMQQAKERAGQKDMEGAYKACKMIFLIVPLSEEKKLKIISQLEAIAKEKDLDPQVKKAGAKLLDETEKSFVDNKQGAPNDFKLGGLAKQYLDQVEFQQLVLDKRADKLLEQTELGFKVEDIIGQKREIERKSRYFTLGPGDILQISVRDHPELSGNVQIKLDGEIVLPLTNDIVMAKGLTVDELTQEVSKAMQRYVKDPQVNVTVTEYKSKIFYVVDEIGATPYPIARANFTLRDALFISDWGSNRALGRVLVIKPSLLHPVIKTVNAFDLIYKGRLVNNVPIENGDVIYIPQTIVGKTNQVVTDLFAPLRALDSGMGSTNNIINAIRKFKGQNMAPIKEDLTASD